MKCYVCGTQLADNAKFCGVCGTVINQAPADVSFQQKARTAPAAPADVNFQQKVRTAPAAPADVNFQQKVRTAPAAPADVNFQQKTRTAPAASVGVKFQQNVNSPDPITFISGDEHEIAKLSNSAVTNLIAGEGFKSEGAVLTNKRLYYNHKSGIINVRTQEEIVDVKDITGTKIANFNPLLFLILAGLSVIVGIIGAIAGEEAVMILAGLAVALVLVAVYFITKKSHLRVEYAGGAIYFSVKKYGKENVLKFQKQIHIAKAELEANNK